MALSFHVHLFLSVVICTLLFGISLAFIFGNDFLYFPIAMTKYHDKRNFPKKVFDLGSKFQRVVASLDLMSGSLAAGRRETGTAAETQ